MEEKIISVSLLTTYIKSLFDKEPFFDGILVEGEISNFKRNASGHLYFTLKDENAQISCVMFRGNTFSLKFIPKDGAKVYVRGKISVYQKSGTYQIYVDKMEEKGLGDLYQKYEELKKKLELKGYFDKSIKKPLPEYPKCIALLTSKTGAVIEDLKSIILKRSQFSNIVLYPTKVQGEDAKYTIVKNIERANMDQEVDVIILARGGGSIEDLWPFNEEIVADAIHASKKPIISAIGHETDFTISDFTADLRAATPSDAALIVVKDNKDLKQNLDSLSSRLYYAFDNKLSSLKSELDKITSKKIIKDSASLLLPFNQNLTFLSNRLDNASPKKILENKFDNLKNLDNMLNKNMLSILKKINNDFNINKEKLKLLNPASLIAKNRTNLVNLINTLNNSYSNKINALNKKYSIINEKMLVLNPLSILSKGFSVTYNKDNVSIKDSTEVKDGDIITTKLYKGEIISKVIKEK
ncbi:MAG: exodeoxyribonuclease VII large subunit [Gammaproteobacteria bacterium]|nr:exodeoxyribonuclease VII large subunit [Gammaproteobacteria bacterium]